MNKECDSQAAQAAIVVSNQVSQPVSNILTLPSGQTSLINTIGQNEPKGSQLQLNMSDGENELKGSKLQLNTNDGENNIPSANDSNEFTVPQTDGPFEYEPMYESNSGVDHLNKSNIHMDQNNCAMNLNNYDQEKNSNVAENENCIIDDVESDVDSEGEFEIKHVDPEDEEIKLLVFQRDEDKYFLASLWAKYPCCIHKKLFCCEKCEPISSLS